MRLRHYLVSLFAVLAIVSCASSGDEPSPFDQTVAESVAAEAPSSSVPTTRAVPRATEPAASMAEQHERMTSTKCRDDVDPVQCMYDRQAYLEFFERSAAQSLDPSYDESLNGMFETLYGQHAEFVSKGCPTDPSAEGCSFAIMFSDIGMTALGVMFSVK